ncbi:MAG: type II toxin-antitoxin system VapC family toxin [bacterium]
MKYVTDTHTLIWHMTDNPKLSQEARRILSEENIVIPCIFFFELLYLIEKKKITVKFDDLLMMISSSRNYQIEPICLPIIRKSRMIPREIVADPWDRLIVATSMHLDLPLISRDKSLNEIGVKIIW